MKYTIITKGEKASTDFINDECINELFSYGAGYNDTRIVAVVIEPNNDNACADHDTGYVFSSQDSINVSEIEHKAWDEAWETYNGYVKEEWVKRYGEMDADELDDWFSRDAKYVSEHYVVIDIDMSDEI